MDFTVNQIGLTSIIFTNVEKLNATNAPQLKGEVVVLKDKSINNIIIDMSKTKYCDSSGLSAILLANRHCKDTNGKFVLCGLQKNVEKLIEISQLNRVLSIAKDEKEALQLIKK